MLLLLLASPSEGRQDASDPISVSAKLVSSRPKIRPGEWFPLVFLVEATGEQPLKMGPPDDGTIPAKGMAQTNTRLLWSTEGAEDYRLLPDLMAVQWPRPVKKEGDERGLLELPARIYIPVKAAPKATLGPATLRFALEGVVVPDNSEGLDEAEPITLTGEVTVNVVHPTDPNATDVTSVDPRLFTGWRGETPDWSVMDTRVPRPARTAPLVTWLVFAIPVALVALVLFWAFVTKRL